MFILTFQNEKNIQLGFKICKQDTIITYFPIGVNTEINFVKFIMSDMLSE